MRWRLFRESCCPYEGNYVKDLMALGRPLATTIIVDNRCSMQLKEAASQHESCHQLKSALRLLERQPTTVLCG